MAREAPVRAYMPKQPTGEPCARSAQAPAQAGRCLGAAAQLAAVHRTLRLGPTFQLQPRGAAADARPAAAVKAVSVNRAGLPNRLKAGVEALSGISLDGVKVHYGSPKPAQLGACAYAQGSDIHLAPGQERHLPHEAWHVVQQAQGRVKPTLQMKGTPVNDDGGLPTIWANAGLPIQRVPLKDAKTGQWVDKEYPYLKLVQREGFAKNQFELENGQIVYWMDGYCTDKGCSKIYRIPDKLLAGTAASSPKEHYLIFDRPGTVIMSLDALLARLNERSLALLREPDKNRLDAQVKAFKAGHTATAPIDLSSDGKHLNLEGGRHRILASRQMGYTKIPVVMAQIVKAAPQQMGYAQMPQILNPYAASPKPAPGAGAKDPSSSASSAGYQSAAAAPGYTEKGASAGSPYGASQSKYSSKPVQGGASSSASYGDAGKQAGVPYKPPPDSSSSKASAGAGPAGGFEQWALRRQTLFRSSQGESQAGASHKPLPASSSSKASAGAGSAGPPGGFEQWALRRDILFRSSQGASPESIASALGLKPDWVKQVVAAGK